jgi:hypothetical protein
MGRPTREQQQVIDARRERVIELYNIGFTFEAVAQAISGQFGLENYDKRRAHRDLKAGLETQEQLLIESGEIKHGGALHERRLKFIERQAYGVLSDAKQAGDWWLALSATDLLVKVMQERMRDEKRDLGRGSLHPDPIKRRRTGLRTVDDR